MFLSNSTLGASVNLNGICGTTCKLPYRFVRLVVHPIFSAAEMLLTLFLHPVQFCSVTSEAGSTCQLIFWLFDTLQSTVEG